MKRFEPYTELEKMYIAKFYKHDGKTSIAIALNRSPESVQKQYFKMNNKNLLEHYRSLWDKEDVNALERR
jgi:hypothetical protein